MADPEDLIEAARKGSHDAFTNLVRLHQARVRTYLARFLSTQDRDLVDDLAQNAFLDAYRSLSTYDGESPFDYWLLRLAKNRALTYLRDEQRRRAREKAAVETILAAGMARRLERDGGEPSQHERKLAALRACLEGLPGRSAEMISDYYFRSRSGVDIARELGKKEGAVWVTLLRIRQALRRCVESRIGTGGATS